MNFLSEYFKTWEGYTSFRDKLADEINAQHDEHFGSHSAMHRIAGHSFTWYTGSPLYAKKLGVSYTTAMIFERRGWL
jgi:hypothetical protein